MDVPATATCLGDFRLAPNEGLEGWCWYPDAPEERAVVELILKGEVIRAARATRFLQNRRDLGAGDGHCGFWFPLPADVGQAAERTIIEVRERRLQNTFGRIVFGDGNRTRDLRLDTADADLRSVARVLDGAVRPPALGALLKALGQTLLHLATRPDERARPRVPGLAACLEQVAAIPAADLGWAATPHISVIVPPSEIDLLDLAATLRDASRALADIGAEFILLDDGARPLTALLPTRLCGLQLIRIAPTRHRGSALNAAFAIARGSFLAFARSGGPHLAGLREAVDAAGQGFVDLEMAAVSEERAGAKFQFHRLRCLLSREDFLAMGGFDPGLEEEDMWLDLVDKARALELCVRLWATPCDPRLLQPEVVNRV